MEAILANSKKKFVVLVVLVALNCFGGLRSTAQPLPASEVAALRQIASKLRKGDWDFNSNPCGRTGGWAVSTVSNDVANNVTCRCTNSICNVVSIQLKAQNLTGVLPEEFADLPLLEQIDLSRNYINGSIPAAWGTLHLTKLSLLGNRISGQIPKELGNITTLMELILESNSLNGPIPSELGNLSRLSRLLLCGNNFIGELPVTFGKLTNLTDFRIDGNGISGKIPDFIGNWTQLDRFDMQGTLMEGPIPSNIRLLRNLTELRISDLNGPSTGFPNLQNLTNFATLVLRNCSISDVIPTYLWNMVNIKTLDLSYNNLTGAIPDSIGFLGGLNFMYLTNNNLNGEVPGWIMNTNQRVDISYNNFTGPSTVNSCDRSTLNMVASFSNSDSDTIISCLRKNYPCNGTSRYTSLFINCGGPRFDDYEDDATDGGPSTFHSTDRWAYSSTGDFTGNNLRFTAAVSTTLNMTNAALYTTARLSPMSLKYYGRCLQDGNYTVKLHFAEIMFTDDQTYSSPGRRIFDVSIQGQKVLRDFSIVDETHRPGQERIMTYPDVHVENNTLEIHLYWAGKGTTAIPVRGVYGPLISAISVTPNFDVGGNRLSVGAIVGIVAGSCALVILILIFLWMKGCFGGKDEEKELRRGLELQTGYYTLKQIKAATKNFDPANKIGEGGFGPVYKGTLSDGAIIAVKQLSSKSKQGNREFVNEIGMISALQHPNLVRLFGCCIEGNQLLLIYEYLENNSLARGLFGPEKSRLKLDWPTRHKICMGIARGLAYLHEESRLKIVHRDIKATNVLLDKDLNAKISDFGLAKLDEEENTHISTRIAGTIGYMAPEYAMRGYLTDKADVYSFGIVALEIVSGKSNTNYRPKEEFVYLLDWAYVLQEQGSLLELVDPSLGSHYPKEDGLRMLNLALLCTNPSPTLRPSMSAVVSMLEGKIEVRAPLVKRSSANEESRFKAFERLSHDSQSQIETFSQDSETRSILMGGPWIDSSVSFQSKEGTSVSTSSAKHIPDLIELDEKGKSRV